MAELRLYNTLTRRVEPFVPRTPGRATMYTCGPTVYDYTHIGHLRPALVSDVLARWLRRLGYSVLYISNFTDIDDRIIERAQREGVGYRDVAERYIADYLENMRVLGIDQVDRYVRATDHIPQIIRMIEALVERGFAYPLDGDVYFDVTRDPDYGKLSGRSLDQMMAGARVKVDERKRNPMDFALWKAAKPGEPAWPSPWGPGRPGWHIECSAMTLEYLGSGLDIHAGGDDLIFPHHENEIAQSECFTGEAPFARYWLHNAMVQINEEKMSKSLGNIVALRDLVRRYPAPVLRMFILSTHYRKPLNYSEEALEEARRAWERLANAREAVAAALRAAPPAGGPQGAAGAPDGAAPQPAAQGAEELARAAEEARAAFAAAMNEDLNTPLALAALFDLARAANSALVAPGARGASPEALRAALAAFDELGGVLGLWTGATAAPARDGIADRLVEILVRLRSEARAARDWSLADRIRDDLASVGVVLEDLPQGTRWKWQA
ncbi:MAG: cysteine--tRNA ligase [Firmicutes bacterium]|nr:cysteine--tRNA ligase [Bacillota bacterium]